MSNPIYIVKETIFIGLGKFKSYYSKAFKFKNDAKKYIEFLKENNSTNDSDVNIRYTIEELEFIEEYDKLIEDHDN